MRSASCVPGNYCLLTTKWLLVTQNSEIKEFNEFKADYANFLNFTNLLKSASARTRNKVYGILPFPSRFLRSKKS